MGFLSKNQRNVKAKRLSFSRFVPEDYEIIQDGSLNEHFVKRYTELGAENSSNGKPAGGLSWDGLHNRSTGLNKKVNKDLFDYNAGIVTHDENVRNFHAMIDYMANEQKGVTFEFIQNIGAEKHKLTWVWYVFNVLKFEGYVLDMGSGSYKLYCKGEGEAVKEILKVDFDTNLENGDAATLLGYMLEPTVANCAIIKKDYMSFSAKSWDCKKPFNPNANYMLLGTGNWRNGTLPFGKFKEEHIRRLYKDILEKGERKFTLTADILSGPKEATWLALCYLYLAKNYEPSKYQPDRPHLFLEAGYGSAQCGIVNNAKRALENLAPPKKKDIWKQGLRLIKTKHAFKDNLARLRVREMIPEHSKYGGTPVAAARRKGKTDTKYKILDKSKSIVKLFEEKEIQPGSEVICARKEIVDQQVITDIGELGTVSLGANRRKGVRVVWSGLDRNGNKLMSKGSQGYSKCLVIAYTHPTAALKLLQEKARLKSAKKSKAPGRVRKAKSSVKGETGYVMLTPAKPILELYEERTIKVGTHVICAESKDGILKDEVGIVSFCKSKKVQVRWTGKNCDGIVIDRRPPTGYATCKVSGYKIKLDERRRMAQREFSSRRDSPVMVRLLKQIVAAQDNQDD